MRLIIHALLDVLAHSPDIGYFVEIQQIDELVGKCEADIGSLTHEERTTVESWLHTRGRFLTSSP